MPTTIRLATDADCAAISALNIDVQGFHAERLPQRFKPPGPGVFPPEEVREVLAKPDHHLLLATVDGVPAGYVYVELLRRPELRGGEVTLMEIYAGDLTAAARDAIDQATNALPQPRHTEVFEPLPDDL